MQANQIRKKLGELYHLDEVIIELARLGDEVVPPLGEYLEGSPEVIPHARVAAVRTLGLIGTEAALEQLKKILFQHELNNIDPVFAQSEYVVKNAVIEELMRKSQDVPACDFLEVFKHYRLPAVISAIVKYHILEAIPLLITALEDDVLAIRAAEALRQLGKEATPALLQALILNDLSTGIMNSRMSRQRRILAAAVLGDIGDKTAKPILVKMIEDFDPNLAGAAVAALVKLDVSYISLKDARILLKGALSHEWAVREYCRDAAIRLGEIGIIAALELIHLKSLPDLYGISTVIPETTKSWLVTYIVENAHSSHFIDILFKECLLELLMRGLLFVESGGAISNLLLLAQYNNRKIRRVVARILRRMHDEKAVRALVCFLGDWDRETVKEARESLMRFPKETIEKIAKDEIPSIRSKWKRVLIRIRLKRIIRNQNTE